MSFDHGVLVTPTKGFDLNYPVNTTTYEAKLRSPLPGNIRRYDTQLEVHRLTAGKLRTFKDPDWFMSLVQEVSFEALSKEQTDDLFALYEAAAGDIVQIRDHENRVWQAFLDKPKIIRSQVGRGCQFITSFSFLAIFSQTVYNDGGGYSIGGGDGAPPNNSTPVIGLGEGDFTGSTNRILSPTGHFLIFGGDQLVHA